MIRNISFLEKKLDKLYEKYLDNRKPDEIITFLYEYFPPLFFHKFKNKDFVYNSIVDFAYQELPKVLSSYGKAKKQLSLFRYVYSSLRNKLITYYRKHVIKSQKILPLLRNSDDFEKTHPAEENIWKLIYEGLYNLEPENRLVFKLYYDFPLSSEELEYLIQHSGFLRTRELLSGKRKNKKKAELPTSRNSRIDNIIPFPEHHRNISPVQLYVSKVLEFRSRRNHPSLKELAVLLEKSPSKIYYILQKTKKQVATFLMQKQMQEKYLDEIA